MYPSPTSAERSEDEPPGTRKRTARACDACYKRKIKCDAALPQCNWCSHHNSPCTFERAAKRRKPTSEPSKVAKSPHLAERIARIEKFLAGRVFDEEPELSEASPKPQPQPQPLCQSLARQVPASNSRLAQSSMSSAVPLHFAGRELGSISLFTGIPFLLPEGQEWVRSRTGENIAFDAFTFNGTPWEKQAELNSNPMLILQGPNAFELPPRHVVEAHFNAFRSSVIQRIFPVLHPDLFRDTIKAAYEQPQSSPFSGRVSARACIFAFGALAGQSPTACPSRQFRNLPPLDGESCVLKARYMLPQVLQETTSLDALQVVTLLALVELVSGNLQSANYYGTISARMIFTLGAHTFTNQPTWLSKSSSTVDSRTQTHLRNIFWLCYTLEQDVSLRTGQAQLFSEETCDLTLPPNYVEQLYNSMEFHHLSEELPENPLFPVDLRLGIIKARAYSALYSFRALKKTDAELLKDIRELDDELERWRMSVPLKWRPTLSFSHETPDPNVSMHSVMLRLNYHLCMTIIHQASSRCKSWGTGQGGVMDGVSSSLALSVEASRSTLLYLEAAEHVVVDGVFWTLIFYPMSALLAIFCNILQNPADPQATKDLGLLKTTTGMLERVFLRQVYSVNELVHIKLIADFVNELYRLATCAMGKAWKERSG